jgi:autotransporter-associated beta strand protein
MKSHIKLLSRVTGCVIAASHQAGAVAIDVNQIFDHTATNAAATTTINWSDLTWDTTPTWAAGVTAGIPNGSGTSSLARTYVVNVADITLKQLQLFNQDATTLQGGTITWDSNEEGVSAELGRNRHTMGNIAAGRNFTTSTTFVLDSDLRVTNWVETRTTTYNSNTSGDGKLTLRIVPWATNNVCAMNLGGTAANTHLGGTTLVMPAATMNTTINKDGAFGTGVLTLEGNGIINLNLNGRNQTVAGLASGGSGAHVLGNATAAAAATLTVALKDGATSSYAKKIGSASATYGNNLSLEVNKAAMSTGTGVQVLSGINTFTGTTTVNGGTLTLASGGALQGSPAVSVAAEAAFRYSATTNVPLALPGTLGLAGGTATTLGTSIGASASGAAITVAGLASATAGNINVDITSIPGVNPTPGTYTLLSGAVGSTLDGATYTPGSVKLWKPLDYTLGTLANTATEVTVEVVAATPLTAAYWKGGLAGSENVWAISNGSSASNWTIDAGGAVATPLVPGPSADVVLSASGASEQSAMLLGADMSIKSLTVTDTAAVSLGADGKKLTITPSSPAGGLSVDLAAGATTIAAAVGLGADQTWTNDSATPLVVSGAVSGGFGLTVAGNGGVSLDAVNSYTGTTTVAAGTLTLGAAGSIATSPVIDVQSAANLDVTALGSGWTLASTQTLKGNGTVTGLLFGGTGTISPGASTGSLAVSGDADLTGSKLVVEVDDTQSPKNDTLAVTGELDIDGATLELDITGPLTEPAYVLATYGAGMLTGNFAAITGDPLPPGYELSYTHDSGTAIAIIVDATAPNWTLGWPFVDSTTGSGFTVRANQDETGTAYYVVVADGATPPTSAQVKAGTDSSDGPALQSGNLPMVAGVENTAAVTGLAANTDYDVWFVAEDSIPNLQSDPFPVDASTATPFGLWIATFDVGVETGVDDDPDKDGNSNLVEFALNSSPDDGSSGARVFAAMATVDGVPDVLTLTAAVRSTAVFGANGNSQEAVVANDGISYLIEAANNLDDWGGPVVTEVTGTDADIIQGDLDLPGLDEGWIYRTFRSDGSGATDSSEFMRVKVTGL